MKALEDEGTMLPVIGFNNSIMAQCCSPTLTSVDNRIDAMCPTAITMLKDILNGRNVLSKVVVYPKLIERESFKTGSDSRGKDDE
jgi:LacI family transcriptional regulator/LacI family asc operon transcriptional repressor